MSRLGTLAVFVVACIASAPIAYAQDALSVTVTPPLFQLSIGPGEEWSSSIKVVNNNPYEVAYAAQVVDFRQDGETGQSTFIPLVEQFADDPTQSDSLARWIVISPEPVLIPPGKSGEIPFTVRIPEFASPGGHYAAIMIGPKTNDDPSLGSRMKISSYVTSLLFVRIKGDVHERGRIREFTSEKTLYQTPEAKFVLRFENLGNTHLRPTGAIEIYNMWGKERGEVLINEKSGFGNVLPSSIRRFEFTWTGERNPFDIGRYSAVVTLGYGEDSKQNVSATTYFWVIPLMPLGIALGILLSIAAIMMWFIRRYIRRALMLEGIQPHPGAVQHPLPPTLKTLVRPIQEGVVDLRSVGRASSPSPESARANLTVGQFVSKYRLFFVFLAVVIGISGSIAWYFGVVLVESRSFDIETAAPKNETLE